MARSHGRTQAAVSAGKWVASFSAGVNPCSAMEKRSKRYPRVHSGSAAAAVVNVGNSR